MHHLNKTLKLGFNKKIDGVAHNALDDAKGQAIYVMQIQEGLKKMKSSWVQFNTSSFDVGKTHENMLLL
jgi:hypothetical protein